VYEGENEWSNHNTLIGEFTVTDIQRAKAGAVKFEIKMEMDTDSILSVTAKEKRTGKSSLLHVSACGPTRSTEIFCNAHRCHSQHMHMHKRCNVPLQICLSGIQEVSIAYLTATDTVNQYPRITL
jgi:hypothetical protein